MNIFTHSKYFSNPKYCSLGLAPSASVNYTDRVYFLSELRVGAGN